LQNLKSRSKERLTVAVSKKLNTSFIGAIARMEVCFGHLWGHGKNEDECSPSELRARKVWDECRTEILNNGNNQIRAVKSEIRQYDILWNRHHLDLLVKEGQ
jgi:hypothetical protein